MKKIERKVLTFKIKKYFLFLLLFSGFVSFIYLGIYLLNLFFSIPSWPLLIIPMIGFYGFIYYIIVYYQIKNGKDINYLPRDKYKEIYDFVEETSKKMKIKPPHLLYYNDSDSPNAFAFGITKNKSFVILNKSLIDFLTDEELKGVISHELTHIKNNDVMFTFLTKFFTDSIRIIMMILTFPAVITLASKDEIIGNETESKFLRFIMFPYTLSLIIFFALMRTQEWLADYEGAKNSGLSKELAFSLNKINNYYIDSIVNKNKYINQSFYFVNPFSSKLNGIFKTHPDIEERIEVLEDVYRDENF